MKLYKYIIGISTMLVLILIWIVSKQNVKDSFSNYWELQVLTVVNGNDFKFKSFEQGELREIQIVIPSKSNFNDEKIPISFKNLSNSVFFTFSFDQEYPRESLEIVEFYPYRRDTIRPNIYGCGTGLKLKRIEKQADFNVRTFNPYRSYLYEIQFRDSISTIPDSIEIRTGIVSFSVPWSNYRSEYIYSNPMKFKRNQIKEDLYKFVTSQNKR